MKLSSELKKITQECQHAEKMAKKWTEKAERKRQKVTELENLAMIDFLRKNKVSIDDLPQLLENLPSKVEELSQKQGEKQEKLEETSNNKEDNIHDEPSTTV